MGATYLKPDPTTNLYVLEAKEKNFSTNSLHFIVIII